MGSGFAHVVSSILGMGDLPLGSMFDGLRFDDWAPMTSESGVSCGANALANGSTNAVLVLRAPCANQTAEKLLRASYRVKVFCGSS